MKNRHYNEDLISIENVQKIKIKTIFIRVLKYKIGVVFTLPQSHIYYR